MDFMLITCVLTSIFLFVQTQCPKLKCLLCWFKNVGTWHEKSNTMYIATWCYCHMYHYIQGIGQCLCIAYWFVHFVLPFFWNCSTLYMVQYWLYHYTSLCVMIPKTTFDTLHGHEVSTVKPPEVIANSFCSVMNIIYIGWNVHVLLQCTGDLYQLPL